MSPLKAGSEAAFQQQVVNLAQLYAWRCYHTHDSRRSQAGFPDLVLVRGAELIFAELKTQSGRVRTEQTEWIQALTDVAAGVSRLWDQGAGHATPDTSVEVFLWRPDDFDRLHARLARGRHLLERAS